MQHFQDENSIWLAERFQMESAWENAYRITCCVCLPQTVLFDIYFAILSGILRAIYFVTFFLAKLSPWISSELSSPPLPSWHSIWRIYCYSFWHMCWAYVLTSLLWKFPAENALIQRLLLASKDHSDLELPIWMRWGPL